MRPSVKVRGYIDASPCIISAPTVVVSSAVCEMAAVEHLFIDHECLQSNTSLYLLMSFIGAR